VSGDVIHLVPKRLVDFSNLPSGSTQDLVLMDRVDLKRWPGVTMLARVHSHTLSNGAGSIVVFALPTGHTLEDPGVDFVGSIVPPAQAVIDSTTPTPAYLTSTALSIGPQARIIARGTRTAVGTMQANLSVDLSVADTAVAVSLGPAQYGQVFLAGPTTRQVTINVANQWEAQPSGASFYAGDVSGSIVFNTTTGVVTYTGPTRRMLLIANVTYALTGATSQFVEICAAINNELVGTTGTTTFSQGSTESVTAAHHLTSIRVANLSNGDTFRMVCRNAGSTAAINFVRCTLTMQAITS
jgi:hypothetical protein